ncbi:MAG: phage head closure protein [Patescibacteria group bacterium]
MVLIDSGDYNNRIRIEYVTRTADGMGGFDEAWAELKTVWGQYRQLSGNELLKQQAVNPIISVAVRIRYRSDVTTDNRLYYGGNYLNIIEVNNTDNEYKELLLKCEVRHSGQ